MAKKNENPLSVKTLFGNHQSGFPRHKNSIHSLERSALQDGVVTGGPCTVAPNFGSGSWCRMTLKYPIFGCRKECSGWCFSNLTWGISLFWRSTTSTPYEIRQHHFEKSIYLLRRASVWPSPKSYAKVLAGGQILRRLGLSRPTCILASPTRRTHILGRSLPNPAGS